MNKRHCRRVSQLGGNGDAVYHNLNQKKEDVWRRMHSESVEPPRKTRVDLNWAWDPHAKAQSDGEIKKLLLAGAGCGNETSLSRLVMAL